MNRNFQLLMSILLFTSTNLFAYAKNASSLVNDVIHQIHKECENELSVIRSDRDNNVNELGSKLPSFK